VEDASPDRLDVPDQPWQADSGGATGNSLDAASAADPFIQLIHTLCAEHGQSRAAKRLGVDRKTLWRATNMGKLTPRLRNALERERAASEREAAGAEHQALELRVEGLERRLQDVEAQLAAGLHTLREELTATQEQVRAVGLSRPGDAASGTAAAGAYPDRIYPDVVTTDALPDDAQVFGDAFGLITEWREQRALFDEHWPKVEGLEAEVRMLELETALIGEHRLTLPPGKVPWEWWQRELELGRRAARLTTARSALRRARWQRRLALHRQVLRALRALHNLGQARGRRLTGLMTARTALDCARRA
jgi:hypothetical protein